MRIHKRTPLPLDTILMTLFIPLSQSNRFNSAVSLKSGAEMDSFYGSLLRLVPEIQDMVSIRVIADQRALPMDKFSLPQAIMVRRAITVTPMCLFAAM